MKLAVFQARIPRAESSGIEALSTHDSGHHTRVSRMAPYRASRRRLIAINVLVVSGILATMAIAVYGWSLHASDQQVNEQLTQWAAHESPGDLPVGSNGQLLPEAGDGHDVSERYEPTSPNVFTVILDAKGLVIYDPSNLSKLGLPAMAAVRPVLAGSQSSTLVTETIHGYTYRLYSARIVEHGQMVGLLQTGISLAARDRQLHDLLLILVGAGAGVLLLTALASLYLADRALVPLRLAFGRQRQFAAAASHELRTPLAIMRSQAELVERYLRRAAARDVEGADRAGADVQEILTEVDYMSRLVRDLLVLARDETDQRGLAWKMLDANALAKEATTKVRSQADSHSLALTLVTVAEESPAWIRGDADRLRQLLLILLENAIRYTNAGGAITVEVRALHERHLLVAHADVVQIVVTDTGRGINPVDIERIFEPFYRAAHTHPASQDGDGAGLGLALARWIATAHGGQITVRSQPGSGSSFTVSLRAAKGEYAV